MLKEWCNIKTHKLDSFLFYVLACAFIAAAVYTGKDTHIIAALVCMVVSRLSKILNRIDRGDND